MIAGIMMIGILSGLTGTVMALSSGFGIVTSFLIYIPGSIVGAVIALLAIIFSQNMQLPGAARIPLIVRPNPRHSAPTGQPLSGN